jgi:hypothetical protein
MKNQDLHLLKGNRKVKEILIIKTNCMKKTSILFLLAFITMHVSAQKARLNGYGSYVFDDSFSSYYDNYNYYSGKISGGFQWGVGLEYLMQPHYGIELIYFGQSATAPTSYQEGQASLGKNTNFDLHLNYILLGFNRHLANHTGKVEVYGGLEAGMLIADIKNPDNGNTNSETKFAWGLRLGTDLWVTPKVGIKLQTQLLSAVQGAGGGFYFGTGGTGVGVSTYSTIFQFGLGGGLTFKLGK